jgi:hypothetical protein
MLTTLMSIPLPSLFTLILKHICLGWAGPGIGIDYLVGSGAWCG